MYKFYVSKQNGSSMLHGDYLDANLIDEKEYNKLMFLKLICIWSILIKKWKEEKNKNHNLPIISSSCSNKTMMIGNKIGSN